jgi:hypothetical protein
VTAERKPGANEFLNRHHLLGCLGVMQKEAITRSGRDFPLSLWNICGIPCGIIVGFLSWMVMQQTAQLLGTPAGYRFSSGMGCSMGAY